MSQIDHKYSPIDPDKTIEWIGDLYERDTPDTKRVIGEALENGVLLSDIEESFNNYVRASEWPEDEVEEVMAFIESAKANLQLQEKIKTAKSQIELELIIENAEPRQENGHKTAFSRHLDDVNWYEYSSLQAKKDHAIQLCQFYNK